MDDYFVEKIRQVGAQPYFYQTWAREATPEMQATISKVYDEMGAKHQAPVIRVG